MSEIKSSPAFFDADDLVVTQHFSTSADGTRVPYFLVTHRDSDGPGPVLLDGYGAFRAAQLPGYMGPLGRLWLSRGGSYALANIRGGGDRPARAGGAREQAQVAEDFASMQAFGGYRRHDRRPARGDGRQRGGC